MNIDLRTIVSALLAVSLVLAAGCGVNTQFVYRPDPPVPGAPKLPAKVAVLPFADGTEDFTQRGSMWDPDQTFNLPRTGMTGVVDAITPELWAKMFAEDLSASGRDDSVVGEKRVESVHTPPNGFRDGCGLGIQCMADRQQAAIHKMEKQMLSEARAAIIRAVAAPARPEPPPKSPGSPEQVIRSILGKP